MNRTAAIIPLLLLLLAPASAPAQSETVVAGDSLALDWSRVPEYRLVPGDELVLNFGPDETRDPNERFRRQRIRPDGRISVYPTGDVVAAGRTVRELEATIITMLGAELKRPRLSIELAESAGNQVHVLGQVGEPGSYPAGPFLTVTQAIARAGGFKDDASRNSVLVFHRDGARTVRVTRVRLGEALKRGRLDADPPLGRFDIVYVPRSGIGNLNVFANQFFTQQLGVGQFALLGWELFNLDRVFIVRTDSSK